MSDLVPVRGPVSVGDYVELGGGRIEGWARGHVERITPDGYLHIGYGPRDWPEYFRTHNWPVDPGAVVRAWRRVFTSNADPDGERRQAWAQLTLTAA